MCGTQVSSLHKVAQLPNRGSPAVVCSSNLVVASPGSRFAPTPGTPDYCKFRGHCPMLREVLVALQLSAD